MNCLTVLNERLIPGPPERLIAPERASYQMGYAIKFVLRHLDDARGLVQFGAVKGITCLPPP